MPLGIETSNAKRTSAVSTSNDGGTASDQGSNAASVRDDEDEDEGADAGACGGAP